MGSRSSLAIASAQPKGGLAVMPSLRLDQSVASAAPQHRRGRMTTQVAAVKGGTQCLPENLLAKTIESADVAPELGLLAEHPFDELPVLAVRFQSSQQELGVGAQGGQWIAQLVHQGLRLATLFDQVLAQLKRFQLQGESMADGSSAAAKSVIQAWTPLPLRVNFRT